MQEKILENNKNSLYGKKYNFKKIKTIQDSQKEVPLTKYEDNPPALKQAGLAYAIEQVVDLVASDINGIHLYTMNKPEIAKKIIDATGIIRK